MKDIRKMLKAQAKDVLPDEKLKENIKHELGYDVGTERRKRCPCSRAPTAGANRRRRSAR